MINTNLYLDDFLCMLMNVATNQDLKHIRFTYLLTYLRVDLRTEGRDVTGGRMFNLTHEYSTIHEILCSVNVFQRQQRSFSRPSRMAWMTSKSGLKQDNMSNMNSTMNGGM